ncbi:hypothetical protein HZ992_13035 [Rhizobacter sp. AJA081-3]|uniref:hypothetical protein n=1 Tax=Rhizobacter sp. AJA081-3 TaxID=2753607 RepID=UPI001ADF0D0A|nr:hypothetical protein [Rhizobacter sp. AJA081-3]QTN21134.1 hypothetical protein HZ992_13035 [Rhizobacter sp. AJA081-3]
MENFDARPRNSGGDTDEAAAGTRPPVLQLGAQTLDAARGVNRHHELRLAHHYARLAQAVAAPADGEAEPAMQATGGPRA